MSFPIIALGASAGGLEAYFEFFTALPSGLPVACVVIQHLDPDRPSLLVDLLAKKSTLQVRQIEDGLPVEAGHVYVIPPNGAATLTAAAFRLVPRTHAARPPHPIDLFFGSLAEERPSSAIAVVFSGGDADGARGVERIKQGGGITFAQDPATTRFPSMPRNAIETGCVDYVLRPADIAREIGRLVRHPYLQDRRHAASFTPENLPPDEPDATDAAAQEPLLRRLFSRLRSTHGVDFTHYRHNTLRRRLARRMALRQIESLAAYVDLVDTDTAEAAALYQDFLIRVTHFFRDAEAFEALRSSILPRLLDDRAAADSIRVWVPGCASGEEVYSVAILLTEMLAEAGAATNLQIFGTDVSEAAIERSRAASYAESIAEDMSSERLERFFVKENGRYRVAKTLRDLCIFARHDVTRDPPFSRLDLVSCRNLLIYLEPAVQRRVMGIFHYALRPRGFLMLGPSESVGAQSELFEAADGTHRLFARKPGSHRAGLDIERSIEAPKTPSRQRTGEDPSAHSSPFPVHRAADQLLLARYAPPAILVDDALNILQFRGETARFLEHASGTASLNLHRVLRPALLVEIVPAIERVRASKLPERREDVSLDGVAGFTIEILPLEYAALKTSYLVIFEENRHRTAPLNGGQSGAPSRSESEKDRRIAQLEREITATQEYLRAMREQEEFARETIQSAHEEVLSANEEFQSTNEELETAKEELQSTNEELTTTNDELRSRNAELSALNESLTLARGDVARAQRYADAIVASLREPLLVLDAALKIRRANPAFFRQFRLRRDEVEGQPLHAICNGQLNVPTLVGRLGQVLTEDAVMKDVQIEYRPAQDAPPRNLSLSGRSISGDAERERLVLLAIDDVTDRTADAKQLRDADRRKDEFLAMLAHELRNPLTPITHALRLLRAERGKAHAKPLYDLMERQTRRLARLVDELLDVARISRGAIELKRESLDLARLAGHAARAAQARMDERRLTLSVRLPHRPVMVNGDAVRLEQIVSNLLENASKYTEPGGHVELKVGQRAGEAMLSVRDDGIGLAPESQELIFELFAQVDGSLARTSGGLGIGLTLVRRLLDLHGGRIEVRSAGLGQGAEFIVRLPLERAMPASDTAAATGARSAVPTAASHRVLIVDDNADAADTMGLLVQHWGHEVATANDGLTALEVARQFVPDLALVDIGLPGMDGYEVARRMRDLNPEIVLVALTGYGRAADRDAARAAGFDRHMVKPADLDELQRLMATKAGHRRRSDEP